MELALYYNMYHSMTSERKALQGECEQAACMLVTKFYTVGEWDACFGE